jgi:uncharacterized protein (TIGR04255 family)
MPTDSNSIPDFESPPLIEVAASVQFEELAALRTAHIGLLFQQFRKHGFGRVEEHPPLARAIERFGPPKPALPEVQWEFVNQPPVARHWFVNDDDTELVQVQPDRLVHNWRKRGDHEYPRFDHIRDAFRDDLSHFERFVEHEGLGAVKPTQCELTYVNHIVPDAGWGSPGRLDRLLTVCANSYNSGFLPPPEEAEVHYRFVIVKEDAEPCGRLHVSAKPAMRTADGARLIVLTLTARGFPPVYDSSGVHQFLELAHEWIVRGFASITTPQMHRVWRRSDA